MTLFIDRSCFSFSHTIVIQFIILSALVLFNDCFIVYCCWYRMKNHFKNRLELKRVDLSSHWFIHLLLCIRSIVSSSLWPSSLTFLLLLVAFKCYLSNSNSSSNNCLLLCNAIVTLSTSFYCEMYCSKCNNKHILNESMNEWMIWMDHHHHHHLHHIDHIDDGDSDDDPFYKDV